MEKEPLLPEHEEIVIHDSPSASTSLLPSLTPLSSSSSSSDLSIPTPWLNNDLFSNTNTQFKTDLRRYNTAPAMAAINEPDYGQTLSLRKHKFRSSSIVRRALFLLLIYLFIGVIIYSLNHKNYIANETHPIVDALYFCIVTMCTIGYGGVTPKTTSTKLFSIMFVLVGFGFINVLLTGMVSHVLDLQESLLLSKFQYRRKHNSAKSYVVDEKKGRMIIQMKVGLALGVVALCIGTGTVVMHFVEKLAWLDSFYLSVMSVTTVGGGDLAFNSLAGRLFASIWVLVSTFAVAQAFLYLAQARMDKRHTKMVTWMLHQDMTVSDFLEADIDNNGFVSKSEFVLYKLKEIGKIAEKDILQISSLFDRLNPRNCGKITLTDLMEGHH